MISQSFTKPWCPSLRKCWWKKLCDGAPPCLPLTVFIIIPSKVESLNSRAYTMYSTCFTREQVHNTFTVIFRFVIYFVTLLCNKTLKNICIVNMKSSLTSTFVKTRWSTFTQKRLYYSPKQILSKTKTCVK